MAGVEGLDEVVIDHMRTSGSIDQVGPLGKSAEMFRVQNPFGVAGER
jgi:hypothetical protein